MPSVEELLSVAEVDINTRSTSDSRIEIDADTRIIQMMPQDELFGVESDEKSERKYFKVPKIVGNGVDLSKLQLRINYQNASKLSSGKDMYIVTDATVYNDEWVYFSWELSRKVTLYKGTIYFVVCAVKADSKGNITNEWNTTLAMGKVLEGLEVKISQEQQYQASDYLEQLKQQLLQYSEQIKETFPDDYTETVENVKNLQSDVKKLDDNKITKFYTNNQGQKVLNDSDDGKIQDLVIYGKSEQKQYKGTNLAINTLAPASVTDRGITFTVNEDKSITLNGTSTADNIDYYIVGSWFGSIIATLDANKDYTIRAMPQNVTLFYGTTSESKAVYQTNGHEKVFSIAFIFIRIEKSGTTFNNVTIYPQINEGTTLLDYEPYVGGKPSPSPEYQQEIKAVVNPTIKTVNNLIDVRRTNSGSAVGITFTINADGSVKLKGTATSVTGNIWYAGQYPYDLNNVILVLKAGMRYFVKDCRLFGKNASGVGGVVSFIGDTKVLKEDVYITGVRHDAFEIGKSYDTIIYPYVSSMETQVTLPYELYAIPVESGGNVTIDGQQYIADYVDVEKGVLVRNVVYKKITSSMDWESVSRKRSVFAISNLTEHKAGNNEIWSNMLMYRGNAQEETLGYAISFHPQIKYANYMYIQVPSDIVAIGDVSAFKKWLSDKDINVLFVANNKEEIDLTQDQIEAFKVLSTYYPKTYISAESEQLEAYTMFNYPVSMEKGWEYVKQQISDDRKYIYDMDTKLTETEASTLEAKIDTAILSEIIGG